MDILCINICTFLKIYIELFYILRARYLTLLYFFFSFIHGSFSFDFWVLYFIKYRAVFGKIHKSYVASSFFAISFPCSLVSNIKFQQYIILCTLVFGIIKQSETLRTRETRRNACIRLSFEPT